MIDRYSTPEMTALWMEEARLGAWLEVQLTVARVRADMGTVPKDAARRLQERARFDVERVKEIEETTHHDVIAFLTNVAEYVGDDSKYLHFGMTSSDMLDTALALQLKRAGRLLADSTRQLGRVLQRRALEHRDTVMVGRTHGVHAEPISFGQVLGVWAMEVHRGLIRLERATEQVAVGKLAGAVGTYATIEPEVESGVMQELGLLLEPVATQVVQRDRHADFLGALALLATTLEKISTQVRHFQRTEVLEAEEYFAPGQKGSSAMPHKRNPIISERLSGQARVLRGNMVAAYENVPLWHERDISHSSVERVILPDSTILLHYMLEKATSLIERLIVYPERMRENLEASHGLIYSQRVLLALVEKGMARDGAYQTVQKNAMRAWDERRPFRGVLGEDEDVRALLSDEELDALFDPSYHLRNAGIVFDRIAVLQW